MLQVSDTDCIGGIYQGPPISRFLATVQSYSSMDAFGTVMTVYFSDGHLPAQNSGLPRLTATDAEIPRFTNLSRDTVGVCVLFGNALLKELRNGTFQM